PSRRQSVRSCPLAVAWRLPVPVGERRLDNRVALRPDRRVVARPALGLALFETQPPPDGIGARVIVAWLRRLGTAHQPHQRPPPMAPSGHYDPSRHESNNCRSSVRAVAHSARAAALRAISALSCVTVASAASVRASSRAEACAAVCIAVY